MKIFGKKNSGLIKSVEKEQVDAKIEFTFPSLVSMNDGVNICATACASCWDTKIPDQYKDRMTYIGKRTKTGHTSIIEHSNVVFYVPIEVELIPDLMEFLSIVRYANTVVKPGINFNMMYLLIGGSWRAFADIYLNAYSIFDNKVLMKITQLVYQYIPSDGMRDIIDMGILEESMFANNPSNEISLQYNYCRNCRLDEDINIVNMDSFAKLKESILSVCPEPFVFTNKDLMKLLSVTIEFNNMSRIITQQLTRHRNGITQESQRYVNYSGACFNSPAKFRPDKYDPKYKYTINFGGTQFRMDLQTIGDNITKLYGQLTDKLKNGDHILLKEDARAFLPNNTQCGKIFMTFTYYSLVKFLQLREDPHAQAEIRSYGERIGKWFRTNAKNDDSIFENDIYDILKPNMITTDYTESIANMGIIDSVSITKNTVEEGITQEEYANIIGESIKYTDEHPEEVIE